MVDVLAFGAHPDDCEFACGGILCRIAAEGKSICIADLTSGDKGSHGSVEERRAEGNRAARLIGAERLYLSFKDCEIIDSYDNRLKLVAVIRTFKPKIVLAPLWKGEQNHPDHTACGIMARHACRYARFRNVITDTPPHRVGAILHYLFPVQEQPDFLVDVSNYIEQWKALMSCHESQLKTNSYIDWNVTAAAKFGIMAGTSFAQGLVKSGPLQIDDLMTLSKGAIEI